MRVALWAVGGVDSVCELMSLDARAGAEDKMKKKNAVCGAQGGRDARAHTHARHGVERDWARGLFGSEFAGLGPASRADGAALPDRDVGAGVVGQVGAGGINAARGLYSICSLR
jgi:hypothetical protein